MKKIMFLVLSLAMYLYGYSADFKIEAENMTKGGPYASTITSPFSGIGLFANTDNCSKVQNISNAPGKYDVVVNGASSNTSSAKVSLEIDGTEIASFTFSGTSATSVTKSVTINDSAGNKTIKLVLKSDNDTNDTYIDWISFTRTGNIPLPAPAPSIPSQGAYNSGNYRNMFLEAGYSQSQIDDKLSSVFNQLFYGDSNTERVYYEKGSDEAYILDVRNKDVRSEGQSYGLMICVQMKKKKEFDKLWKFAKTHMQNSNGYFAWQANTDGSIMDSHAAPDGDIYFATALYFASTRFGNGSGIYNYRAEADNILVNMLNKGWPHNSISGSIPNMFNPDKKVCFVPYASASEHSDPSYHLPAFLEVWGMMASTNNQYWKDAAAVARNFIQSSAHPSTGLTPDYANYDGSPHGSGETSEFTNDAMRTIVNAACDYHWFKKDEREKTLCMKIQSHFESEGMTTYYSKYTLDGQPKPGSNYQALSLVSCNAVGSLASSSTIAWPFIKALWEREPTVDQNRYYDGMLQMMALLHLSGQFRAYVEQTTNITVTGVSISPTSATIATGSTKTLSATVAPSNASNKSVTWTSNNTSIARVSTSGIVTGKSVGKATITANTSDGNKKATCTITVTEGTIGNNDDIISVTAPTSVQKGTNFSVSVNYSASQNRDIIVMLQKASSPWTTYAKLKKDVSAGSGTLSFSIPVGTSAPVANGAYQIQTLITTDGGSWNTKQDYQTKSNISVTDNGTTPPSSETVDCTFGVPRPTALPSLNKGYSYVHVIGNGPNLDNITNVSFNWSKENNSVWEFSMRTNNGNPDWYVNLTNKLIHTFANPSPAVTITGSGFVGLDGQYWATLDGTNLVLVAKSKAYTLYFSESATIPCANLKSTNTSLNPEIKSSFSVIVYPNPSSGNVSIHIDNIENTTGLFLYDLSGKTIYSNSQISQNNIQVNNLEKGVYIVKVTGNNSSFQQKLVVQ